MPVIVKLSRKVYDRLGDDVVGELVEWFNEMDLSSHASVRELNELNFSRFDSKMEQRLAELRADLRADLATKAELTAAIGSVRKDMAAGFASVPTKAEMTAAIETSKAELLKWMVVMWVATLIAPFLAATLK